MKEHLFDLPDHDGWDSLVEQLAYKYWIREEPAQTETLEFLDTFDWRLYKKSLVLFRKSDSLFLRKLDNGEAISRVEVKEAPVFAWDLPDGELKTLLAPLCDVRALLKMATVDLVTKLYRIVNEDAKTVVRLRLEQQYATPNGDVPVTAVVHVVPVRGYPKYNKGVANWLTMSGLSEVAAGDVYSAILATTGKRPGDYSSALDIRLTCSMRVDDAVKAILRHLLQTMKINAGYVKGDVDTEFLHDYRVSVRRTRAALSLLGSVFPEQASARFRADFATIGKFTNQLRDLDVYLLSESAYRKRLPPTMRDDLAPLFDHMRAQRDVALQEVADGLDSEQYGRIMAEWEAFLNEPLPEEPEEAIDGTTPIVDLACEKIYKRYRRVVKMGSRILANTQDEHLHALRIEAKKLRYLMEFFAGLFPRKGMTKLVDQLKRLQDNLGEFNDLDVQQKTLLQIAEELPRYDTRTREALIATGRLVEVLCNEQQAVKANFALTFRRFASSANHQRFRKMFTAGNRGR